MTARSSRRTFCPLMLLSGWLLLGATASAQIGEETGFAPASPLIQPGKPIDIKSGAEGTEITLTPGQMVLLRFDTPIESVQEFDQSLLFTNNATRDWISLTAQGSGETDLKVAHPGGTQTRIKLRVKSEVPARLRTLIEELYPDAQLQLHDVNGAVLVRGTVAKPDDVGNIASVIKQFGLQVLMQADVRESGNGVVPTYGSPSPTPVLGPTAPPYYPARPKARVIPVPAVDSSIPSPDPESEPALAIPQAAPSPVDVDATQSDLRSEIRALHTDVKRLIELLERRESSTRPTSRLTPPERPVPAERAPAVVPTATSNGPTPARRLLSSIPERRMVLYFYADWAAPSREYVPDLARIAAEEVADLIPLDVGKEEFQTLAQDLNVFELPALVLVEGRRELERLADLADDERVRHFLRRAQPPEYEQAWNTLGLRLRPMQTSKGDPAVKPPSRGGMVITEVRPTPADEEPLLREGDILVGLGIWETPTIAKVAEALKQIQSQRDWDRIKVFAIRDGEPVRGFVPITGTADMPKQESAEAPPPGVNLTGLEGTLLEGAVLHAGIPGSALLYFHANWSGPCQQLMPVVRQVAQNAPIPVQFVDVDAERALVEKHRITTLPTCVVLRNGQEADRLVGAVSAKQLEQLISRVTEDASFKFHVGFTR